MPITISGDSPNLTSAAIASPVFSGTPTGTGVLTNGTAVASTSGTSIDFTGIPSWVKRITVMLNAVATSGTAVLQIQLGDSGGVETTGYVSNAQAGGSATPLTSGFGLAYTGFTAGTTNIGVFVINLIGSNSWAEFGNLYNTSTITVSASAGAKTLSATLDRVRITTVGSTDTFTAGTINILYE
jgi:hypothetical protein